jgi:hypothetical protein
VAVDGVVAPSEGVGMTRPRVPVALRRAICATFAGLISVAVLTGTSGATAHAAAAPATPPPPLELKGEGAWSAFELNTGWHNDLSTGKSPIDLHYTAVGSHFGRLDFLNKGADWALSGIPFSDAELAQAKMKRSDIIDAPAVVSSLGMLFEQPSGGPREGFNELEIRCDPFDESTWPPDITTLDQALAGCDRWKPPYTGVIKVPWANLAAMLWTETRDANGRSTGEPMNSWNEPGVLAAFGVSNLLSVPLGTGPSTVLRSDPDETMYYMEQFTQQFAPTIWNDLKVDNPQVSYTVGESLPRISSISRGQADQQADQLHWPPSDPGSGFPPKGGVLAPVPASIIVEPRNTWQITNAPANYVQFLPVENANGDYVEPTTDSLTKAAAAGLDTPLYAFSHKVPGAYPFTWIDHLYAPAHGLSIDKTNALATLIRYIATAGQAVAATQGEGMLPPALVQKSLDAANALVESNCVGSDRIIVKSTDPGAFAPTKPVLTGLGTVSTCAPAPVVTTTTAPPTTIAAPPVTLSSNNVASSGQSSSLGSTGSQTSSQPVTQQQTATPPATQQPASADTNHAAVVEKKKRALLVASGLPIQPPTSSTVDRLGAFLLGVMLFLLLRRPIATAWHRVF